VIIDISKLSIGLHELDFEETAEELNIEDINLFPNPIFSHVDVDKSETHIYIKAAVKSKLHFSCDRCLEEFEQELSGDLKLYFEIVSQGGLGHLVDENGNQDDSVRVFRSDMKVIDLTPDSRDILLLAIPLKTICSEDCKGICPRCGTDLNNSSCSCKNKEIDPRWEGLKKLLAQETKEN